MSPNKIGRMLSMSGTGVRMILLAGVVVFWVKDPAHGM